jgi:2'-5' RNA ligase
MNKRHRIFIAINLPREVKKYLAGFEKKWPLVPAKWTDLENLHITLLFLGDITDVELGQVCQIVKEVVKNHNSFNIILNKIGYGPVDKIPPRYIWAGGPASAKGYGEARETNKEASLLKKDLEDALWEAIKFKIDKNVFNSHITLARIKEWEWRTIEPEERPEVNENIETIFTVDSLEVMESELTRQGPRYTVIESYQLQ